jgi:hypothetical protein
MIITIIEPVAPVVIDGALHWRVEYERRDGRGAGTLNIPQGTPGQERLRRGAVVEVTRSQGNIEVRAPLATMRMLPVVAVAA